MLKLLAIAIVAIGATTANADAAPKRYMRVINGNTGQVMYDDGRLDGRACAVGRKAVYNPYTGQFITVPAMKCNF